MFFKTRKTQKKITQRASLRLCRGEPPPESLGREEEEPALHLKMAHTVLPEEDLLSTPQAQGSKFTFIPLFYSKRGWIMMCRH